MAKQKADLNLPIVNALAEQTASNKDNRERLQKSLRAGLLNVTKSVDRLHDAFSKQLDLQREAMAAAEAAADRAEFARIEAAREEARKQKDEGDVNVNVEKEESSFAGIAAAIAAITAGLAAAAVGFASELAKTINSIFKGKGSRFIAKMEGIFDTLTRGMGQWFDDIMKMGRTKFQVFAKRMDMRFNKMWEALRPIRNFFARIAQNKGIQTLKNLTIKPLTQAFDMLKDVIRQVKVFVGAGDDVVKGVSFFGRLANVFRTTFSMLQPVIKIMGTVGRIVGRLFVPFGIIMAVWDTVKGAIEGFEQDGILGGFEGALKGLLTSVIGAPLDMLKSAVSWVLGKFGFDKAEETLDSFSFSTLISDMIGGAFNFLKKAVDWVKTLFTDPTTALKNLWEGYIGVWSGFAQKVMDWVVRPAWNWIKGIFGFGEDELVIPESFNPVDYIVGLGKDLMKFVYDPETGKIFGMDLSWDNIKAQMPDFQMPTFPNPFEGLGDALREFDMSFLDFGSILGIDLNIGQKMKGMLMELFGVPAAPMSGTATGAGAGGLSGAQVAGQSTQLVDAQTGQPIVVSAPTTVQTNSSQSVNQTTVVPAAAVPASQPVQRESAWYEFW